MSGRNVVLIGFMGAGKSVVGAALAHELHYTLYDTDAIVERDAGMPIAELWATEGEQGFRDREHEAVRDAVNGRRRVIACGGGAIVQLRNYEMLKGAGTVVYLRASAKVLRAHVGEGSGRPLLADPAAFDRLLAERAPAYESAADVTVDAGGRAPAEIAVDIAGRLP